jgi:hypothetical protein
MKNNFKQNQKGNALIITVLLFVAITTSLSIGLTAPTISAVKSSKDSLEAKKSYAVAESGIEDVFYRIRNSKQVSSTEILSLGSQQTTTTITDISSSKKQINSIGDSFDRNRTVKATIEQGVGVSFSYGVQTGKGGFTMSNNSQIIGSVYSNGPITGSGSITGSATSANSATLASDQSNGTGIPIYDIPFGNANSTQDFAQSFQISDTEVVNKVQLYLKKVGTPSNLTVKIVTDSGGSPSTVVKTSGVLSASSVSTNYPSGTWSEVIFPTKPQLDFGVTYWIVIDASTSASNYYIIGANNNGYTNGVSKIGTSAGAWANNNPSGTDGFFSIYVGGVTGLISGITIGTGAVGDAYSNTVNNSTIRGTNYCKVGTGNNKSCNTSLSDPIEVSMPISDANIQDWKDVASDGGTYSGNYVLDSTIGNLGPKKITGNLSIKNNANMTVTGTIWVQGDLDVSNNATVSLASGYGSSEGVIIVDGTVYLGNNANFTGSGTSGSYVMVLSTSNSTSAITVGNNAGAVILYASNGTINVSNNAGAKSITGYSINLNNNAVITYDSGLANSNFSSGPGGSWNVSSWKEQ